MTYHKPTQPKPIQTDDLLEELIEFDSRFNQQRNKAYRVYRGLYATQYHKPSILELMSISIKNNYLQLVHTVARNTVLAATIGGSLFTGVAVSAAQLTLPNDSVFKPSNVVEQIKKQIVPPGVEEQAPYKTTESVENGKKIKTFDFSECGLIETFPNDVSDTHYVNNTNPSNIEDGIIGYSNISALSNDQNNPNKGYGVSVACLSHRPDEVYNSTDPAVYGSKMNFTIAELKKMTGWNIFDSKEIYDVLVTKNLNLDNNYQIHFGYHKYYFGFDVFTEPTGNPEFSSLDKVGGIYANQIKVDFNPDFNFDVVNPSQPSVNTNPSKGVEGDAIVPPTSASDTISDQTRTLSLQKDKTYNLSDCGVSYKADSSDLTLYESTGNGYLGELTKPPVNYTIYLVSDKSGQLHVSIECTGTFLQDTWDTKIRQNKENNEKLQKINLSELVILSTTDRQKVDSDKIYKSEVKYFSAENTSIVYNFVLNGIMYEIKTTNPNSTTLSISK